MIRKKIIAHKNKALRVLIILSAAFCLQTASCKKQSHEPEIKDYYDPYAPSPKSKFDSVKAAQTFLTRTSENDSLQVLTTKKMEDGRSRK